MAYRIEETGNVYGRLTVLSYAYSKPRLPYWLCRCECGNFVTVRISSLRSGQTASCGCLHKKHGMATTRVYHSWKSMMNRCYSVGNASFERYGGRGIKVCKRWHEFTKFYEDMKPRLEGTSLDRINNDKGYSKTNCRWATKREQARNRGNNVLLTYKGRTQCLAAWCEALSLPYGRTLERLKSRSVRSAFEDQNCYKKEAEKKI